MEFERARKEGDESTDETKKMVKRTLFGFMNPFPQKKVRRDLPARKGAHSETKRSTHAFRNCRPTEKGSVCVRCTASLCCQVMTFNKHVSDFTFEVNYADQEQLSADQMQ